MRFVVYGAGAVGGVIGGRLHEAGHQVVLVARGGHFEAIRRDGLRLESPDAEVTLAVDVVDGPGGIDWRGDEVVLLTVKSQDTEAAVAALAQHAPDTTPVVSAQNGVANEPRLLRSFANVYGMCVMAPAAHLSPGVVAVHSSPVSGILDLGRYPTGTDDVAAAVSEALRSATFVSAPRPDIMRWKYRKLVMNLGNAIQAVCGPEAYDGRLHDLVRDEAERCLELAEIEVTSVKEEKARRGGHLKMRSVGPERWPGGSSWQSLQRATGSIETDFLNGEVVLLGRLLGIPTPANALLQRLANDLAHRRRPPGELTEEAVLAQL
ncbi:MAG: ketopantoate reductase family protein [Nocardioidaceae bacterium]